MDLVSIKVVTLVGMTWMRDRRAELCLMVGVLTWCIRRETRECDPEIDV